MGVWLPVLGFFSDCLLGDPRTSWHPVVLMGHLIAGLEKVLLGRKLTPLTARWAGLLLVFIVLALTYCLTWLALSLLFRLDPWVGYMGSAVLLSFTISPHSLAQAGQEIKKLLTAGELSQARTKLSWIVGRDTASLDTGEITRATVETVAENTVDGVISPLFYAFIGGVPLAFVYRAVNTMDSMVGYRNDKYRNFGMVAARVDDGFNYLPARITGVLIILAAAVLRYDWRGASKSIWRDAASHPSPNSGIPEAGVAGALGIRLGGQNFYGGVASFRAYLGENINEMLPEHIARTINMMYTVTALFLIIATGLSFWLIGGK